MTQEDLIVVGIEWVFRIGAWALCGAAGYWFLRLFYSRDELVGGTTDAWAIIATMGPTLVPLTAIYLFVAARNRRRENARAVQTAETRALIREEVDAALRRHLRD